MIHDTKSGQKRSVRWFELRCIAPITQGTAPVCTTGMGWVRPWDKAVCALQCAHHRIVVQ